MRILILLLVVFELPAFALSQRDFSMGIGMETRAERDVNPDYVTPKYSGVFYAKLRLRPWDALLETSRDEHDSGSGGVRVNSESTRLAGWGRFEFRPESFWTPFVAAGAGLYLDKVDTSFPGSQVSRRGTRGLLGLGAGFSFLFWEHLTLEAEGRVESVELALDPVLSGMLRLGCQM